MVDYYKIYSSDSSRKSFLEIFHVCCFRSQSLGGSKWLKTM